MRKELSIEEETAFQDQRYGSCLVLKLIELFSL